MKEKIKELSKKWWFWVIVIIVVLMAFSGMDDNEEKNTNTDNNVKEQTQETKINKFLEGTNSDDFAEILKSVTGIENIDGLISDDLITYTSENSKYSIKMISNKDTKEICYVKIIALTSEDATNVFMSLNRINYKNENNANYTSWLVDNIGKESTTKIGEASFSLSLDTNNHSVLEMKTDGSENYINK